MYGLWSGSAVHTLHRPQRAGLAKQTNHDLYVVCRGQRDEALSLE